MYNKNEYNLNIFLLSKESGRRLMSALLEAGFSVASGLESEKMYIDGRGSVASSLLIYTTKSLNETDDDITAIIEKEQIYYFGYMLINFRLGTSRINGGFMPEKDESITNGPYR
jgi:hypothetical protein